MTFEITEIVFFGDFTRNTPRKRVYYLTPAAHSGQVLFDNDRLETLKLWLDRFPSVEHLGQNDGVATRWTRSLPLASSEPRSTNLSTSPTSTVKRHRTKVKMHRSLKTQRQFQQLSDGFRSIFGKYVSVNT